MKETEEERARFAANWDRIFATRVVPVRQPSKPKVRQKKPAAMRCDDATAAGMEKLKGLSLRQPWAEQIMRGEKLTETRRQSVAYRGRIYIYASLSRFTQAEELELTQRFGYSFANFARGVVVGTVEITDCQEMELDNEEDDPQFMWQLANPMRLVRPVPPLEQPQPVWFHPFGRPVK